MVQFLPIANIGAWAQKINPDQEKFELLVQYRDSNDFEILNFANEVERAKIRDDLANNPAVRIVEDNYTYKASIIPSDTYFSSQWYLKKIKAPDAWSINRVAKDIVIAIIDSGVQIEHPDLKDNIWTNTKEIPDNQIDDDKNGYIDDVNGWDFVNNVADPGPKFNNGYTEAGALHGTIVAGIAAAYGNNGTGISGVVWQTQIMPLKVLDDSGSGDTSKVIRAIDYAIANGADIINFSFVGFSKSALLEMAIRRAYNAELLIVAAAGNDEGEGRGINTDEKAIYPACHDGSVGENMVIGVTATDALDEKADFASFGYRCIDISAPGVSIYSTSVYAPEEKVDGAILNRYYDGYWAGTSMATPMVAATAALVQATNPRYTQFDIFNNLLRQSDNINPLNPNYFGKLGVGRLNVFSSVKKARADLIKIKSKILVSPNKDHSPLLKIVNNKGETEKEFLVYGENFLGGVNIASGDVDGDGFEEIVVGAKEGGGPHVRIFSGDGKLKGQFFAYNEDYRGGISIAVGDVSGDKVEEIIVGLGLDEKPLVRIFDKDGVLKDEFLAFMPTFNKGVNVVVGDVDGDSQNEIVVGAGIGGGPQVRIFGSNGKLKGQFFAYNKNFRGGVRVSLAKVGTGSRHQAELIVTSPGVGGGPHIRIFDHHSQLVGQFFAYNKNFRGGVNVSAKDCDNDGVDEIITGAGPGGAPHLRVFEIDGTLITSFYAFDSQFSGGVNVGLITY